MDLANLKNLISKLSYPYQDVEIDGQLLAKGARATCAQRWQILKPHIGHNKVIIDVGSDLGYFSQRIAQDFKDNLVISIEQVKSSAEIQKEICQQLELYNMVVCNSKFWIDELEALNHASEMVDTIMFLAVLHHYEADEERKVLKLCSQQFPKIIIEYTVKTGPGAWGGKAYLDFNIELHDYYKHVEILGETVLGPSEKRIIIQGWNDEIVREGLASTFPRNIKNIVGPPNHRIEYKDNMWVLRSKTEANSPKYPLVNVNPHTGFSMWNLLFFNTIWPLPEWIAENVEKVYEKIIASGGRPTDIHAPNVLVTPQGIKAIDYNHPGAPFNKEQANQEIEKVKQVFLKMKPF